MENVGMLVHRGLREVLGSLAEIGYNAEWQDIRASDVGAPHRRERIWIVAYSGIDIYAAGLDERGNKRSASESKIRNDVEGDPLYRERIRVEPFTGGQDVAHPSLKLSHGTRSARRGRREFTDSGTISDADGAGLQEERPEQQTTGTTRNNIQIPDATMPGLERKITAGELRRRKPGLLAECGWWSTEPDVGRTFNGVSARMDKVRCLTFFSHISIMAYVKHIYGDINGKAKRERTGEVLQALRDGIETENIQWQIGGFDGIQEKEILLSFLRELSEASEELDNVSSESKETFEREMRELRMEFILTGPSHRSRFQEQREREYSNSLQALSRLLAHDCKTDWKRNCRENARIIHGWERNIPRIATGVPSRVDRLKGLGNSIVPQIAEILFQQIMNIL